MHRLTEPVLLDSNIPMYAAGREHPLREPARRIVLAVVSGELDAYTNAEVLQEILARYLRSGQPSTAFAVFDAFHRLMHGRVLPIEADDVVRARVLAEEQPSLSPRDYIHWAVMISRGIRTIVTADRHFEGLEGITRLDPTAYEPR